MILVSTFMGYLKSNPPLKNGNYSIILTHNRRDEKVYTFSNGITEKANEGVVPVV